MESLCLFFTFSFSLLSFFLFLGEDEDAEPDKRRFGGCSSKSGAWRRIGVEVIRTTLDTIDVVIGVSADVSNVAYS